MTSEMIKTRIIEEVKQIIDAGLQDVPNDQIMEIMPKINTAVNCYCVDKMLICAKHHKFDQINTQD